MNKLTFEKFLPIVKVDTEEQMVYGWASTPDMDSDGEIIKAEALAAALPEYLKFPTIREMHQPKAIGKTKQADASNKGLYIGAKIVDTDAWEKVKEGVYAAFSIGGNVIKRVGNMIEKLELVEISLVDVPANKAAIVDLWKTTGDFAKNASGVSTLTYLMNEIRYSIGHFDYMGKDCTELKSMLETVKGLISTEALEPEEDDANNESMLEDGKSAFYVKSQAQIAQRVHALEHMDFEKGSLADSLRRGVIIAMKTKSTELEKGGEGEQPEVPSTETPTTGKEEGEEVISEEPVTTEAPETPAAPDSPEKGVTASLTKVNSLLSKVVPEDKKVQKNESLEKSVTAMADTLEKMAGVVVKLAERVAELEKTPAAPKSKSTLVHKTIAPSTEPTAEAEVTDPTAKEAKKEFDEAQAKLKALDADFEKMGANAFAKAGKSMEAGKLKARISILAAQYGFK